MDAAIALKAAILLPKGWELAKEFGKKIGDTASYDFRIAHNKYCDAVVKKYCRARTFFVRDEPQFLDEFYVPASVIRSDRKRIERANLGSLAEISRRLIVTGNGGSGKTVFMRYLLLDAIERGVGYPVFIELRNFNECESIDLESAIVSFMKEHGFPLDEEFALRSLKEGLLIILIDGFDEVVASKRKALESAIRKLATSSASQIVISSRPDMVLEGWDGFISAKIAPLELEEACELIQKIKFDDDDEIKSRFIKRLKSGLFKSHQYFLSNPLLLSIMLLTYGDSADIPRKFASFYEQAYAALFQKHDALKSGYRRERHTSLDIYEFARLFSAFCAITYDKRAFRFSQVEAVQFVGMAKRVAGFSNVDADGFLLDAKQAVCLLVDDGLDLAFVHRSFQEYFVARFITECDESLQTAYILKMSSHENPQTETDNVLRIVYEISAPIIEENYLIPALTKMFGKYKARKLSVASWKEMFRRTFSAINLHKEEYLSYTIRNNRNLSLILFVLDHCLQTRSQHRRLKVSADLSGYFSDNPEIVLNDVAERSPFWRDMANNPGEFSIEAYEEIRQELLAMERRSIERETALGDIFSFAR